MKLTILREALLTPLQAIAGVVERKQTMPVLANVLLIAEDHQLSLTGSNMEVELLALVNEVNILEPGKITVPARKLAEICKSLSDKAELTLSLEGDRLLVRSGASQFSLSTLPAGHFPNVEEEVESLTLDTSQVDLKFLLNSTAFAMAQQDVRYYLNGLLLEVAPTHLRAVATDGHRLAMSTLSLQAAPTESTQVIVPRKGVLELVRLLSEEAAGVQLKIGKNHLRAVLPGYTFTCKLIEGKFPDYNRVIPRGGDKVMTADRSALKATLQRAAILSHENIRGVRLHFEADEVRVFANNPDQEKAEDALTVDYKGEALQIGFNVSYLIEVLNVMDSPSITITMASANSSGLLEAVGDERNLYVVMPMRL